MKKLFTMVILIAITVIMCTSVSATERVSLVYSNLSATPTNYNTYNCYGYAINTYQNKNPGAYSGHTNYNIGNTTISTLASYVADDLSALGYTVVGTYSTCPTLSSGQKAICIVRGYWTACYKEGDTENDNRANEGYDYHCYKKTSANSPWYHKMSTSSALMYLKSGYTPSNITITDECYNGAGVACPACWYFPSPSIRYIVYT